jgi:hypothetical protein
MRENKTKKSPKKIMGIILFFIICFALGGFLGLKMGDRIKGLGFTEILGIFLAIYLGIFIHINIHEFGHFLFGKLFKYTLIAYAIGPIKFENQNGKMKIRLEKSKGYAGLCAMIPKEDAKKNHQILYTLGGVIFNIISSILLIFIGRDINNKYIKLLIYIFSGFGILLGVINLIPYKSLGNPTDGMVVLYLIRNNEEAKVYQKIIDYGKRLNGGIKLKDMELITFDMNTSKDFDVSKIQLANLAYMQSIELKEEDRLKEYIDFLEHHLDEIPTYLKIGVIGELIFYYCHFNKDEKKAKKYYKLIEDQLVKDKDINGRRKLGAFKFYIEEKKEEAKEILNTGLLVKNKYPMKTFAELEEKIILEVIKNII